MVAISGWQNSFNYSDLTFYLLDLDMYRERHLREKLRQAISEWDHGNVMCKTGYGFHCFAE